MIRYRQDDIRAAHLRWKNMRVAGTTTEKASVEDLAVAALTARFPATRLAAMAELVSRLKNDNAAHLVLDSLVEASKEKTQNSTGSVDGSES